MFHKLTEDQEIQIAQDRAKAKAGFAVIWRCLKWLALAVLLSFVYCAGEFAAMRDCLGLELRQ